jgi:DNA-binding response OmpR family regulator
MLPELPNIILTVNDDSDVRETIGRVLQRAGCYHVLQAADGPSALRMAREHRPDVIILDAALADTNSFELCQQLRGMPWVGDTPILFLSGQPTPQQIALALDHGGDSVMPRPSIHRELPARVRALLRRAPMRGQGWPATVFLCPTSGRAGVNGAAVELTRTEFDLLDYLCRGPYQTCRTVDLLEAVWGYARGQGDGALVRNHVRNLRRKIEDDPEHPRILVSHPGRGYAIHARVVPCVGD